jgi:hypothetical protein
LSSEPTAEFDPLLERLDRLTAILELALAPQLAEGRAAVRADEVDAAILDAAASADWTPAANLQNAVATKTGKKERAIQGHVGALVARGFLLKDGGGTKVRYRTNGVI